MNPFLSVIMPVYNGEKFIAETLESVREQHREGIELVIVDDGSTDRTLEIVNNYTEAPSHSTDQSRQGRKLGGCQ